SACAAAEASRKAADEAIQEARRQQQEVNSTASQAIQKLQGDLVQAREITTREQTDAATIRARLEADVRRLTESLKTERAQIETIQQLFQKEFEAISNRLFVDNSTRFNQQSAENLQKLLAPLKETLGQFKTSLDSTRQE